MRFRRRGAVTLGQLAGFSRSRSISVCSGQLQLGAYRQPYRALPDRNASLLLSADTPDHQHLVTKARVRTVVEHQPTRTQPPRGSARRACSEVQAGRTHSKARRCRRPRNRHDGEGQGQDQDQQEEGEGGALLLNSLCPVLLVCLPARASLPGLRPAVSLRRLVPHRWPLSHRRRG